MAQRGSGYARMPGDTYVTPDWVYHAAYRVEPRLAGYRAEVAPVERNGYDFLADKTHRQAICTNPPFSSAEDFCWHALEVTKPDGIVGMLLPVTFDCAKGRRVLFEYPFKSKLIITTRIRWTNLEQKKAGPSTNHAWYFWDWLKLRDSKPIIGWV